MNMIKCDIPSVEDRTDLTVLQHEFSLLAEYFGYRYVKQQAEVVKDEQTARVAESMIRMRERQMRQWTRDLAWNL